MKFIVKHEINGRLRIHVVQKRMTYTEADTLSWFLSNQKNVTDVKVYERTADAVICYVGTREEVLNLLKEFSYENTKLPEHVAAGSGRELNAVYQEKLVMKTVLHYGSKLFLPMPVRAVITSVKSVKYIWHGIRCLMHGKIEVPVLDATAISVSVFRRDYATAGSVMFLLGIGEIIEEWTHKKSVGDLARSMSLNVNKVWLKRNEQEILVKSSDIEPGDHVVIRMGNVIPFDGEVVTGEGMVNQASLTGESLPVRRSVGQSVFAGTVLEEGEIEVLVKAVSGSTRFEKIVTMIEDSEKLKSSVEGKAEHLADRLVPYTLLGTGAVWLLTRNITKTLSVLMVDFSCALKLAMPITVLSAIREAGENNITVKGGKFLEAVADADTIVFDKTGTLTKATPTVKEIVPFSDYSENDLLRIAACLEEHFPHSMAKAVVDAAKERHLSHEEMHSKVEYVVAHGISSSIDNRKVLIGSSHFIFEDEGCTIPSEYQERYDSLKPEYSHLYLAIEKQLVAVICIEDPLREEAVEMVRDLKKAGIRKVVMMTGDSERTAAAIAKRVGVDEYYAEVLPEDKANFVEKEKSEGRKVIMIGDGINDSPALSAADAGIAISDGAEIAREIADITIAADDLREVVTLKLLANAMMKRIHMNYRNIVGINSGLILLGVTGIVQPTVSALLHNASTLMISLGSMKNLLDENKRTEHE
ncbi:heavy metal translocating P-type ATPase [Mediterraneibacter faecis]|uniref:heavy metal translocating P-type ATPase n=1 Tax=Mediterraneibacter faecis TaxID=592978 RepID=UPI000E50E141|nr:heavy metal translocating P-type ATPase [Mediterraneibacter faecis]MCB5889996.1 heavy metal translocating P-type ATPase [Lachnospiraceae bacterium 210521-DFI.4.71]RGG54925.1 heavy metal translocating P-type ATPase [Ruminococcus sp. AF19-4LB]RGH68877.1 heavy metal translocating P-type ATPase [Ruminococcus sp. AM29-5AC]RGH72087.1 heavy metal translocating P-type ATPase [Ruminococcus sp. AM29-1LB]RGH75918.1 heavy metal translocating P-type ATPase [Ruminococcus sp. AM29-19LB]RGH78916.1 heavy m